MIDIEVDIIRYEQIKLAVVVVINKSRAGGPACIANTSAFRDVAEGAVAIIFQKTICSETGYVDIVPAVVIVVADGYSHAPTDIGKTRFVCEVGKGAVAVIVIESAASLGARLHQIYRQRINEEDIEVAIVVVIKERHSAT